MRTNHKNNAAIFERFESRTMMSAAHFVEPAVDGNVTSWLNVSHLPLFAPGGPVMRDIRQGDVGDCWFMASLGEVAQQDPRLIRQDIRQRADRTYDVYFHNTDGTIVDEHVDGTLPMNGYGYLEYAGMGTDNCTWAAIMEKAFTCFRDQSIAPAYQTISGGSGWEALSDLGGTVTEILGNCSTPAQLFSNVVTQLAQHHAVDFSTASDKTGPLVGSHVYSVVSTRVTKAGVEEISVRNPWAYNPNFVPNAAGYGSTNNGYLWVPVNNVFPQFDEVATAVV